MMQLTGMRLCRWKTLIVCAAFSSVAGLGHAALFEDGEARQAILDLRQRVEKLRLDVDQTQSNSKDELGRGLLELQRQMELLRSDVAVLRDANEKMMKELADLKQRQRDDLQSLSGRIVDFEPTKVTLDGEEFSVGAAEKRDYESALAVFQKGDFQSSQTLFTGFLTRYPATGYAQAARFWLGNSQYATRAYKESMAIFRTLIAKNPEHLRAPEAVLSVANCQLELKDTKGARTTLTDLIKAYPQSEAASAARERLGSIK